MEARPSPCETTDAHGALHGVTVLDCSRLLPGGYCTMVLGDLGADVIKIEEPGTGDYIRSYPPFNRVESHMYLAINRNKRSLTLNLKHEDGKQVLRTLAATADVLVEGNRPGVMDKLGLGYSNLSEINPRLIYCSITGYGQTGPYARRPGHDLNYMGVAGALELFAPPGHTPDPPGLTIADLGGGAQNAVIGILAALHARHRTGRGQHVDIAMTDGAMAWLTLFAAWQFGTGQSPRGGQHVLLGQFPCYAVYETRDGLHITVGCLEPHFWANLCAALDRNLYAGTQFGFDSPEAVFDDFRQIFLQRTRSEWIEFFEDKNVCVGPSYRIDEALIDPHNRARAMAQTMEHPTEGVIQQIGIPIKLSATPGELRTAPPALGQHTREILHSIGYSEPEIDRLAASGAI
ncbi:MAG: CoA transferase [Candidatus Hydrogenedentota bacterium]